MIKSEHRAIFSTPLGAYELTGISDELKLDEYIESKTRDSILDLIESK